MSADTEADGFAARGKRLVWWLNQNFEEYVLIALFTIMVGIVANEVFRRFVLNDPTRWGVRVATYIYVIASWMGASYAAKMRLHLKIELVQKKLPPRVRFGVVMISNLLFLAFLAVTMRYLFQIVELQRELGRTMFGFKAVVIWPFTAASLFGMVLIVVRVVQNTFEDYRLFVTEGRFVGSESLFVEE